jgi:hypothetical protein
VSDQNVTKNDQQDDTPASVAHVAVDRLKLIRALVGVDCPQCRDMIIDAHYGAREAVTRS